MPRPLKGSVIRSGVSASFILRKAFDSIRIGGGLPIGKLGQIEWNALAGGWPQNGFERLVRGMDRQVSLCAFGCAEELVAGNAWRKSVGGGDDDMNVRVTRQAVEGEGVGRRKKKIVVDWIWNAISDKDIFFKDAEIVPVQWGVGGSFVNDEKRLGSGARTEPV